jgi:hypothetical protein
MWKACCVLTVACLLIGCGDSGSTTETVPFKATDTSQFEAMKNAMMKKVQTRDYKGVAPPKAEK